MLTDTKARQAKPLKRPRKLSDRGGLYLYVSPAGAKSWRFDYRLAGRRETLTIGRYPDISLLEARERHGEARKLVAHGISPANTKKCQKAEAEESAGNTFKGIAESWRERFIAVRSEAWRRQIDRLLNSDIYPAIGDKAIREVTPRDILGIMQRMAERGAACSASIARQIVSRIYQHAIRNLVADYDPAQSVRGATEKPATQHHPALAAKEIPAFLMRLESYYGRPATLHAIRLLLLTFVRKMELLNATWDELDLKASEWRIPAARMKMREPHIVPLSRQALSLFMELEPLACGSRYVFPHLSRLDRPMGEVTVNLVIRAIGYSGRVTPHGLRATASTVLNEQGWRPDVIERQLAHAERNKSRAAYHRAEYLAERRAMMQHWADYIDGLCAGNVVAFRQWA